MGSGFGLRHKATVLLLATLGIVVMLKMSMATVMMLMVIKRIAVLRQRC